MGLPSILMYSLGTAHSDLSCHVLTYLCHGKMNVKKGTFEALQNTIVYPTCDHSFARAPTLKPQGAEKAVYCKGMNYAIV